MWFRTYKVGSTTIANKLKNNNKKYIHGSLMGYYPRMFKKYFKFSFVRNPESRLISAWKDKVLKQNYFKFGNSEYEKMKDINYFISWVEGLDIDNCNEHIRSQNSLIDLNNIDFIGRFENFAGDYKFVMKRLKIDVNIDIEHYNKSVKLDLELTADQRLRIYNIYTKDFQIFYPDHKRTLAHKNKGH